MMDLLDPARVNTKAERDAITAAVDNRKLRECALCGAIYPASRRRLCKSCRAWQRGQRPISTVGLMRLLAAVKDEARANIARPSAGRWPGASERLQTCPSPDDAPIRDPDFGGAHPLGRCAVEYLRLVANLNTAEPEAALRALILVAA
jgi:hypothetical protein